MRRRCPTMVLLLPLLWPGLLPAQLQLVPDKGPQQVFAGEERKLLLVWRNPDNVPIRIETRARLYQASSATAMPIGDFPWKTLELLPRQTVIESAALGFPSVPGETPFLVQWIDPANRVLGLTEVRVYPTNLLEELRMLAGDQPLGLWEPPGNLKPLLDALAVDYIDLGEAGWEAFAGRLAIIGPFSPAGPRPEGLARISRALARKGVAVLWVQTRSGGDRQLSPSYYPIPTGKGAIVVAQTGLVANLAESPEAQLNLVRLARLAVHPEPLSLP